MTSPTVGEYEEPDNKPEFIFQQMSGQQHSLYEALREVRQDLASMYLGALMTFHSENPDQLAQAAHSLRELMEKLPEYLDVPVKGGASLGEKVKDLAQAWKKVAQPPVNSEQLRWTGMIDAPLRTFLVQVEEFFTWQESNRQSRTHKKLKALRQLDPMAFPYVGPVSNSWVKQWTVCHEYFELVSHHRHVPTDDEFASRVSTIEQFLLDRLRSRTFDDHTVERPLELSDDADWTYWCKTNEDCG